MGVGVILRVKVVVVIVLENGMDGSDTNTHVYKMWLNLERFSYFI